MLVSTVTGLRGQYTTGRRLPAPWHLSTGNRWCKSMQRIRAFGIAMLPRVDDALSRYFFFALLVAIGVGYGVEGLAACRPLLPYLLGFTMVVATSRSSLEDLTLTFHRPSYVIAWLSGYGLAAAVGIALSAVLLGPSSPVHAGFTLMWLGPAATITAMWTQMASGNVALAVTLTAVSVLAASLWMAPVFALLSPVSVGTEGLGGANITWGLWSSTVFFVLVPAVAGALLGHRFRPTLTRARHGLGVASKLAVLLIVAINTSAIRGHLSGSLGLIATVLAITAIAQTAGHAAAWRWGLRMPSARPGDSVALGYATSMRNTVLALTLASTYLPPTAALAPTVAFLAQEPLCALMLRIHGARVQRLAARPTEA